MSIQDTMFGIVPLCVIIWWWDRVDVNWNKKKEKLSHCRYGWPRTTFKVACLRWRLQIFAMFIQWNAWGQKHTFWTNSQLMVTHKFLIKEQYWKWPIRHQNPPWMQGEFDYKVSTPKFAQEVRVTWNQLVEHRPTTTRF
jgi:hypothetical protein